MIVPNSFYTCDTSIYKAKVTSVGSKYITVAHLWDDGSLGRTIKFNNDERMNIKDFSYSKLFLGTKEEWLKSELDKKKAADLYNEISVKLNRNTSLEKLQAIKDILYKN